ncbi:hypothetical protein ABPG75_010900 [Micractinium tetrahymenae]
MSDVEEGEIEGELGAAPEAPAPPEQLFEQPEEPTGPRECALACKPCGRAPYFADPEDADGFKGRLPGGKKKKKKQTGAAATAAAAGFVDVYGAGACAEVELYPEAGPIRLADVQNLLLWVLGEGANPRWCFVKNKPLVKRVLLLAAHGLDKATWEAAGAAGALPAWRAHLGQPVELQARNATLAPGSTVHSLLTVPQTKKRRREESQGGQAEETEAPPPPPPEQAAVDSAALAGGAAAAGEAPADGAAANEAAAVAMYSPEAPGAGPAGIDLHDAAHGVGTASVAAGPGRPQAAAGAAGAAGAAAEPGAAQTPPEAAAPKAKRMKLAPSDDVSTRVQPQLEAPAAAPEAAGAQNGAAAAAAAGDAAGSGAVGSGSGLGRGAAGSRRQCSLPPSHYVLTLEQLQEHNYPLPQLDEASGELVCPPGFVATQACRGKPQHDLVAVDCEMCITEAGFELTRVTLVDREGKVLLDELVLPHNPITDHNTRFSGITAEMLEGVTTRLEDVQARIRELVPAEAILVAHSGENDLQALKLIHANVIDTSVLYPHPRGPPFKSALRVLASRHLLRTIQQGEHNPVEDARAAMDLALLKFQRGPAYGAGGDRGDKLIEVLGEAGRRSVMVDRLEVLNRHVTGNCSAILAEGDAAVVAQLCKELKHPQVDFVWGQLTALQQFYEQRLAAVRAAGEPEPSAAYRQAGAPAGAEAAEQQQETGEQKPQQQQEQQQQQPSAANGQQGSPDGGREQQGDAQPPQQQAQQAQHDWQAQQAAALSALDASLAQLWEAAPAGTLLVVVTGQGDTSYSRYLQEQKWRRQQGLDGLPPWGVDCEAHLAAVNDRAMSALCFAAVKRPAGAAQAR